MIVFRLGHEEPVVDDLMGRTEIGYRPGLTESEYWERGRGLWKLKEGRAIEQDLAVVVDPDWVVRAVAEVTGISKWGAKRAVEGRLIPGHPMVGRRFPAPNASKNAVSYHDHR